ncbi:uncharacterized protein LOC132628345 [Lycium barbarum]|uniref:uncharacterized protein LOC132628345 n=1 Tax=Lycium barbarum TaxID=112863 RepID=UPI00293ED46B|nr:uncharacterized protein LOC132628345 [Lycium barbarum]
MSTPLIENPAYTTAPFNFTRPLRNNIFIGRKQDHETIGSYVKKLQSIADALAEINSHVSDQDLVLQLLAGLPSQYSPYQDTISSQFPLPDFSKACSLLYMYETLLQEQETTNPSSSEEGNYNKETSDKFLDMLSSVSSVVSTAYGLWNMFGTSSNKKYYRKRPNGGGGNYRRGPSTGVFRNSGRGNSSTLRSK